MLHIVAVTNVNLAYFYGTKRPEKSARNHKGKEKLLKEK
jgi:hypothetical protein